jgi:hypothetical protein
MTGILQALLSFFGVSTASSANYIEDVFSTYLYTGNGTSQTITNDIDLSGKGGLVWIKNRNTVNDHVLCDTSRGATFNIASNLSGGQLTESTGLTAFNSNGFSLGSLGTVNNGGSSTYASWTFREQAKFFDVVTYTGNGSNRTISHNLGSVPGCIIVKRTDATANWRVYHRSLANTEYLALNSTGAAATGATVWNSTTPTSTEFSLGTDSTVNANGGTYVAYLFAHDAGGFGASGADNVITCGSYTGNGSATGPTITLNYEPQWILIKRAVGGTAGWILHDTMRGLPTGGNSNYLQANSSDAETGPANYVDVNATGFQLKTTGASWNASGSTYIYIAIRRGPMKTPTSGTSVFSPVTYTGNGAARTLTSNFPVDLEIVPNRDGGQSWSPSWLYRLAGNGVYVVSSSTAAEVNESANITNEFQSNVGVNRTNAYWNTSSQNLETFMFRRAPGFFDVVCYTGTGSPTTVTHNLGVVPELIITKRRDSNYDWVVYSQTLGTTKVLFLNANDAETTFTGFGNVTSTNFDAVSVVQNGNQVAYLFATLAGVSKVGSYTGTGTTQTINCGFTAGSRFVMIKRTDSTGDWYVWDSARGIVAGNDPYLLMNSTAVEVTNTDYVDTANSGFEISSTAPAAINANGGSFIFFAVA